MSLVVDATKIKITNASGGVMFDSTQKLVHKKYSKTGSVTIGSSYGRYTDIALNTTLGTNDFVLTYVTPTATNGNVLDDSLNSEIQLNFSMLCDFTHSTTTQAILTYDMMAATLFPSASPFVRLSMFSVLPGYGSPNNAGFGSNEHNNTYAASSKYASVNYRIIVLTYQ